MLTVDIRNLTHARIGRKFVEKTVGETLQYLGIKGNIYAEVAFVGRARIRKLNRVYNKKDSVTDVLSFEAGKFVRGPKMGRHLGEIIVCPKVVKEEAGRNHKPMRRELSHVIIHGVLHLLGYEHEKSKKDAKKMHAMEEKIMALVLWPMK